MTDVSARAILLKHPDEDRTYTIDFTDELADDETIESVESIDSSPSGLTLGDGEVNATAFTPKGECTAIAASKSISFRVSGGSDGTLYAITATCTTSASDEDRSVGVVRLRVASS